MGSEFGAIWKDPEGGFTKFMVKRASKQDQTLHMEGKLHIILYFREEWIAFKSKAKPNYFLIKVFFSHIKLQFFFFFEHCKMEHRRRKNPYPTNDWEAARPLSTKDNNGWKAFY